MPDKTDRSRRYDPARAMLLAVMAFFFLGFFLLALKDGKWESFLLSVVVPAIIFVGTAGISRLFPSDRLLLSLTNFLCALGVLVLYRLSPQRGMTQAVNYGVGVLCMILRTNVDEGTVLLRHGSIGAIESRISVVVSTIAASEDGVDTTLQVLHIR